MASSSTSVTKGTLFATTSLKDQVYDVICIGSGWAARPIAQRAVAAGLTALLIDNELMGGDCPFWACVPSKALLRPIEALHAAGAVAGARQRLTKDTVDVDAVFAHRTAFTRGWDDEKLLVPTIIETGTDLLRGMGRLVGEKKVVVTLNDGHTVELTARHAVAVCTGSVPSIPDVLGLKEAKPWTPREATSSSTVPQHLIVLGAGAVGCEMATAYSGFGAKITLVTAGTEILPKVDKEASELVRKALESRGVRFLLETTLTKAHRTEDKAITVTTSTGEIITASELLVATGRRPQTNGCGLELFGIAVNEAPVDVDESLRVKSVAGNWLYAVGDINGRSPLTHMCKYQGRIAANAIVQQARGGDTSKQTAWNRTSATADHYAVPQVIFTQPAVASTGLTRAAAARAKRSVKVIETPAVTVGALLHGDDFGTGWAQWIVDKESNKLLGMTVVGPEVTDLIHAATVAVVGGLTLDQLAHAVPPFPTMTEVYLNLADAAGL